MTIMEIIKTTSNFFLLALYVIGVVFLFAADLLFLLWLLDISIILSLLVAFVEAALYVKFLFDNY